MTAPVYGFQGGRNFSSTFADASSEGRVKRIVWTLSASSWVTLALWSQTSFSSYLHHGDWAEAGMAQLICLSPSGNLTATSVIVTLGSWLLMVVAMMLPLSTALIARLATTCMNSLSTMAYFAFGYLFVSVCFGAAYHVIGYGFGLIASQSDFLIFNGWLIEVAILALAGLFQFARVKRISAVQSSELSLDKGIFHAGAKHAFSCFLCCAMLMSLMFIFWAGSVVWMAVLATTMTIERLTFRGAPLREPIGYTLILVAGLILASHV